MGMLGLMALPGRLVFTPLGSRWPRGRVTAVIFALQALACLALLATDLGFSVWAFVVLFGAGFGAITPARAALVAERFGPANYGSIAGALALVVAVARAAAPVGASWIHRLGAGPAGGYQPVLAVALALSVAAGAAVLMSDDRAWVSLSEPTVEV
jgi:MFS family permease